MMYQLTCDWCGKPIERRQKKRHNFCSRQCLADFSSKSKNPDGYNALKDYTNMSQHMTTLNQEMNPERKHCCANGVIRVMKEDFITFLWHHP